MFPCKLEYTAIFLLMSLIPTPQYHLARMRLFLLNAGVVRNSDVVMTVKNE